MITPNEAADVISTFRVKATYDNIMKLSQCHTKKLKLQPPISIYDFLLQPQTSNPRGLGYMGKTTGFNYLP